MIRGLLMFVVLTLATFGLNWSMQQKSRWLRHAYAPVLIVCFLSKLFFPHPIYLVFWAIFWVLLVLVIVRHFTRPWPLYILPLPSVIVALLFFALSRNGTSSTRPQPLQEAKGFFGDYNQSVTDSMLRPAAQDSESAITPQPKSRQPAEVKR